MVIERYLNYRSFLLNELKARQEKNHKYSMRAFARDLNLRSSRLSEILNGKVGLSENRALQMAEIMKISEDEKKIFIDLVRSVTGRGVLTKRLAAERLRLRFDETRQLKVDEFELISDWYHLAILELINTKDFDHSPGYVSRRLGIAEDQVEGAIERMLRLGLLEKDGSKLKSSEKNRSTPNDVPSEAVRSYNRQLLRKAEVALDKQSVQERDFSSCMFSVNKNNIARFKDRLFQLQNEFTLEVDQHEGGEKDAVYCFATQLFELTERP